MIPPSIYLKKLSVNYFVLPQYIFSVFFFEKGCLQGNSFFLKTKKLYCINYSVLNKRLFKYYFKNIFPRSHLNFTQFFLMNAGFSSPLDLFKSPIFLNSKGSSKANSLIGKIVSLIIYIFLLYTFSQSDIFVKQSPDVVYQSKQTQQPQIIRFDEKELISAFVADSYNKKYTDESIFNVKFMYQKSVNTQFEMELHHCTVKDVEFNESLYSSLGLQGSFCLKNKSFNLEGYWDEEMTNHLVISIYQCDNKTNAGKCKSQEEINAFFHDPMNRKQFGLLYHNAQIDLYNHENPIKLIYKSDFQTIDPYFTKINLIYLKNAYITTDDGLIFPSLATQSNVMFHVKETDFLLRQNRLDPYIQFRIYASKEEVKCTRKYQKLPEALGSLAGMALLFMIVCMIIGNVVADFDFLKSLSNNLYVFPEFNNQKTKKSKTKIFLDFKQKPTFNLKENQDFPTPPETASPNDQSTTPKTDETKEIASYNNVEIIQSPDNFKKEPLELENYCQINRGELQMETDFKVNIKALSKEKSCEEIEETKTKNPDESPTSINSNLKISEAMCSLTDFIKPGQTKSNEIAEEKGKNTTETLKFDSIIDLQKTEKSIPEEPQKNKLKISFCEYIRYLIIMFFGLKKSPKQEIINKSVKTIRNDINIVNILTKIHEFDILKSLLLNEDQLRLFHYLSKPLITLNEIYFLFPAEGVGKNHIKMSKFARLKNKKERNQIEQSYLRVKEVMNENKIDRKLLELCDERFCLFRKF